MAISAALEVFFVTGSSSVTGQSINNLYTEIEMTMERGHHHIPNVLGASVSSTVLLIAHEFDGLILTALVATPLTWYLIEQWPIKNR